jgi:hypothetical protein
LSEPSVLAGVRLPIEIPRESGRAMGRRKRKLSAAEKAANEAKRGVRH